MTQQRYWTELFQLKVHVNYIELMLAHSEGRERLIKIIIAIASSTSIGAWVIWKDYASVWASIIALSQVIAAVNPYLPYKERIKSYSSLLHEFEEILIFTELNWHGVSTGKFSEEEINKLQFEIRSRKQKSLKKHIQSTTIPENLRFLKKAEDTANIYFQSFYPA